MIPVSLKLRTVVEEERGGYIIGIELPLLGKGDGAVGLYDTAVFKIGLGGFQQFSCRAFRYCVQLIHIQPPYSAQGGHDILVEPVGFAKYFYLGRYDILPQNRCDRSVPMGQVRCILRPASSWSYGASNARVCKS